MSGVYGQLSFVTSDPHVFSEKLATLDADSRMCERVRVLTIWPSAVREAIKTTAQEKAQLENEVANFQAPQQRSYLGKILGHSRSLSRSITPPPTPKSLTTPTNRLDGFIRLMKQLRNVDELEVNWYLDQGSKTSAWKVPIFPELWQSIGHQLRRVMLDIQLFKLNDIVKSCGTMPNIQELDLTLRCDAAHRQPGDTSLPYFLNKFSLTLRSLSIKTIGHQDMSTDFLLLTEFPQLRKLKLIMPLDAQHLSDPAGLEQLLRNHPKITDLCLRYSRCCGDPTVDGFQPKGGVHRIYGAISMPHLANLEFGLHIPIPPGAARNSMIHAAARMSREITSLTLVDRSLTVNEVKAILRLFPSQRLRRLSLFARCLSPQLIDAIAQACPNLTALALDVQAVVPFEVPAEESIMGKDSPEDFAQALFDFAVDLDNDRWRYCEWALADISVMKWAFQVGHTYDWASMQAMAYIVPSVRSFCGMGHTREDPSLVPMGPPRRLVEIGNRIKQND